MLYKTNAQGGGRRLAQTHGTSANPTFLVLRADGQLAAKWSGYEKETFIARLRQALAADGMQGS